MERYYIAYNEDGSVKQLKAYDGPGDVLPHYTEVTQSVFQEANRNLFGRMSKVLTYGDKRQSEYPSIGDQLDALWKGGQVAEDMRGQILAVKMKYPKE